MTIVRVTHIGETRRAWKSRYNGWSCPFCGNGEVTRIPEGMRFPEPLIDTRCTNGCGARVSAVEEE